MVSFLALPLPKQLEILGPLPEYRGMPAGPLRALINAMQNYLGFFTDHFPEAHRLSSRLDAAINGVVGKDSSADFKEGPEWEEIRAVSRELLSIARIDQAPIRHPLPLDEWTYHFK